MKYECNFCNHDDPCTFDYKGSLECEPDRCSISSNVIGEFEGEEEQVKGWSRSESQGSEKFFTDKSGLSFLKLEDIIEEVAKDRPGGYYVMSGSDQKVIEKVYNIIVGKLRI